VLAVVAIAGIPTTAKHHHPPHGTDTQYRSIGFQSAQAYSKYTEYRGGVDIPAQDGV